MRRIITALLITVLAGCATGSVFFLERQPDSQYVRITRDGRSLELTGESVILDNRARIRLESDFYRGYIEIVYEKGEYNISYENLPLEQKHIENLKNDLQAALYEGNYPYSSEYQKFGEAKIHNGRKYVYAPDGYKLYEIVYDSSDIRLYNIVGEYTVYLHSEKTIGDVRK